MERESVAEPPYEHLISEVFNTHFLTNLTNAQNSTNKYYQNYGTSSATTNLSKPFYMITTNTSNSTFIGNDGIWLEHAPKLSTSTMIKVYILAGMAILSFFGNILTMLNIYKNRFRQRSTRHTWSAIYSLIFHLSIADLLVSGFCIVGEAIWLYTVQWLAGELACKLVKLFQMFSLYLSTYILVLIGVDRWIAVKYPMKSLNRSKRSYRLIGGTYVISFLLSLPQFFIFHLARGPFVEEFHQCVTHGFYTAQWQEQLYTTFTLIFTFLLPLCILFVTYISTFCTISSSEKMFLGPRQSNNSNVNTMQTNRQRLIHKAKMKSLRISIAIIIAFIICWTPYYVMMITLLFLNPDKMVSEGFVSAIFVFGMSNSLANPVIYGAFHLHPMKRKASQNNGNAINSFNRADSHRTPSMTTAVTVIDGNGRQMRGYRQPSSGRKQSSGSTTKEHVNLLQMNTKSAAILHKSNSGRSARFTSYQAIRANNLRCNEIDFCDNRIDDIEEQENDNTFDTVVYNCQNSKTFTTRAQSSESLDNYSDHCTISQQIPTESVCFEDYKNEMSTDESVSSV